MKRLTESVKYFFSLVLLQLFSSAAFGQSGQFGPSIVCAGSEYAYTKSDASAVGFTWTITGGYFTSATNTRNVTVIWNGDATQKMISCTYSIRARIGNSFSEPVTDDQPVSLLTPGSISFPGPSSCGNSSGSLSLSGYNGGIVQWESSTDQSNWTVVAGATSAYSYSVTQTTYFRVGVTANSCVMYATRTVDVNASPDAPSVANVTVCASSPAIFTASGAPAGYQYRWYDAGGVLIPGQTGSTYTTPALAATAGYKVSVFNPSTSCESPGVTATASVINVTKPAIVPGTPPCGSGTISLSTGTPGTIKWYTTDPASQPTPVSTGAMYVPSITSTTTFYATVTSVEGCVSQASALTVAPTIVAAGNLTNTVASTCNPKTGRLTLSGYTGTITRWESSTDKVNWTSIAMPGGSTSYYDYSITQTNYFRVVVANGNCSKTSAPVTVIAPPILNAPIAGMQVRCGAGPITLYAVDPVPAAGNTFRWYSMALVANTQLPTYTTPSLSANTLYQVSLINNGCESGRTDINVVIDNTCSIADGNSITTTTLLKEGVKDAAFVTALAIGDVSRKVNYFDGFGHGIQQIDVQGSPSKKDIVSFAEFDAFGRSIRTYLPYAEGSSGAFKANARTNQAAFYLPVNARAYRIDSTGKPFAEKVYEASGLDKVLESGAPGEDWQIGAGHTTATVIRPLGNAEPFRIPIFEYDFNTKAITSSASYQPGDLLVNEVKNEQGVVSISYLDKREHVVAKALHGSDNIYTYSFNVYDALGYLRATIQPEGVKELMNTFGNWTLSSTFIDKWCFTYEYDQWGRQVEKKTPGTQPLYTAFNSKDLAVLTQDGEMRKKGQWIFYKYDALNRLVLSGVYTSAAGATRTALQDSVTAVTQTFENRTASNYATQHGYTISQSFPSLSNAYVYDILSVNYYDDYDYDFDYLSDNPVFTALGKGTEPVAFYRIMGMATGNKYKVMGSSPGKYLAGTLFYDEKGRVIQTVSDNTLNRQDITTVKVGFSGKALESLQYHSDAANEMYVRQQYAYDHAERLLSVTHQIERNGVLQPAVTLSASTYNELGQTAQIKLHSMDKVNYLQTVDYTYNVRGWPTGINDANLSDATDLFGEEIKYNTGLLSPFNATKRYDGNISEIWWKDRYSNKQQSYAYDYDQLNRLVSARYAAKSGASWIEMDGNNETVSYDLNGNISSLLRYQWPGGASARQTIDALSYTYTGNQLKKTDDNAGTYAAAGFVDGSADAEEYLYDANGNTIADKNKGITSVRYNLLNLPEEVTIAGKGRIVYGYDASGKKLSKQLIPVAGSATTTDYVGDFQYANGMLQFLTTDEGRVTFTAPALNYEYCLKDYAGNPRVYFDKDPAAGTARIIQKTDYYPYGMTMVGNYISGTENKYQYNAKEWQNELGLNLYDYGARFYDPEIGRWTTMDPKSEKDRWWSPYNYGVDNPVRNIDPDGMWPFPITIRSFAPFKQFGGYFDGDNRGFSTSMNATSRIAQHFTVDAQRGAYTNPVTSSSPSYHPILGRATALDDRGSITNLTSTANSDGSNTISFTSSLAGSNPLVTYISHGVILRAPSIDVHTNFTLTENDKAGTLRVHAVQTGDAFPAAETMIGDTKGNQLFIGVSPANGGPFTSLAGDFNRPMMQANFTITMDNKGVFTGVQQGDKKYTTAEWNKMNQSKSAVQK